MTAGAIPRRCDGRRSGRRSVIPGKTRRRDLCLGYCELVVQRPEQLLDYLAEARYALVFAALQFQVGFEPSGRKGPDLQISQDECCATVEVLRFRKMYPGPTLFSPDDEDDDLKTYGNPVRDIRKAFEKLLNKMGQVNSGNSVIAIWNDDDDLEEIEVMLAVRDLVNDAKVGNFLLPEGLTYALYGSKWRGNQQFYCFPFQHPVQQQHKGWATELEHSNLTRLLDRALSHLT